MKFKRANDRGFLLGKFKDQYGAECSLQKSSLATEDCIWLGIDEPEVKIMGPNGWENVPIPEGALRSGRMHLNRKMVKDLLPALQWFADTGELPGSTDEAKSAEEHTEIGKHRAFKGLYLYSKGLITIGRLGEILMQSPPVVRHTVVKAADRMRGSKKKAKA